jgi:ketosteroid isomerase-like protein
VVLLQLAVRLDVQQQQQMQQQAAVGCTRTAQGTWRLHQQQQGC